MPTDIRWWQRFATVRAKTTVLAALTLAAALALASAGMLMGLRRALLYDIDEVAEVRAEDVAALARQGTLPAKLATPEEEGAVVQVVDERGRVLASSANAVGKRPIATFRAGREPAVRTLPALPGLYPAGVRVLALAERSRGGPVTIYVATSLEPLTETLGIVRGIILVGAPALLLLVTVVTWSAVGRALRPVHAIRTEAAAITASALDRRVPEPPTTDEVGMLARTINSMLERIERATERQRRFVADASHELQSPLASARTDLEVALAHPGSTEWTDVAAALMDEHDKMERLVQDLLFLARSDEGEPLSPPVPVDLDGVVHEEAARARGGARIDTSGVSAAPLVGRRGDLGRLVRNLLDNAKRHARSTVVVTLGTHDACAVLEVADDGPGIPRAARDVVFERFTRLDEARDAERGGSGLGLAIAREIVHQHHGTIEVADGDGGARFVVRLPLQA